MKRIFAVAVIGLAVACSAPASTDETAETPPTPAESETDAAETPDAPTSPVNLVMGVYNAFEYGDIEGVTANFAPGIVWNEAENSPYADQNPYEGADEIVNGVFARIGGVPATMTISSLGGSCMISPGVSNWRAVSDRETIRCPSQGDSRCPA